jgi:transposase
VNAFEFVLALAIIVLAFTLVRHKIGIPVRSMKEMRDGVSNDAENERLRGQVKQLQERLKVLERIVTDRGAATADQIEALRERDRMTEGDEG